MATSLTQIARFMDAADESVGLRHVAEHHRWLTPPTMISLDAMAARHAHPQSVRLRFLCYNTFLMRVRLALARGLADASTPREVMEALGVTPAQLLDEYDVCDLLPSGPLFVPGPRELCRAAGNAAGYVIGFFGGVEAAADAAISALGTEAAIELVLRLAGVPGEIQLDAKPALNARAREIGDVLRSDGYDVAALCETWNADLRSMLLAHWQLPTSNAHLAVGKPEGDAFMGDGLLFGSRGGHIIDVVRHHYQTRGIDRSPGRLLDLVTDDELWAQKGVLLVRLDAGVGVINLYLTHLYYGEGLAGSDVAKYFPHVTPPTNSERQAVQSAQIAELGEFMAATHTPGHIAVVCGDFNVDANGAHKDYAGLVALQSFMEDRKLEDRWSVPHADLPGATGGPFGVICPASWPTDARFCLDSTGNDDSAYRIDLLLVERPTPQHDFVLDVTRIGRRSFPRLAVTDGQAHMSDHLGLDCTLLASPKIG